MRLMALAMVLGAGVAAGGCAHSTQRDSWQLSRTVRGKPERSLSLDVTASGGAVWKVTAEALERLPEWQVWSVQRRDYFAGSLKDSREVFVNVPEQPDDRPKAEDPSAKDLPPELAKEHPLPTPEPKPKEGVTVRSDWALRAPGGLAKPLEGTLYGKGQIRLTPEQVEPFVRELNLGNSVRLSVTARPEGWGPSDALLHQEKDLEVTLKDLDPPAKGKPAKKGTTQARPPRTGGGSGQP